MTHLTLGALLVLGLLSGAQAAFSWAVPSQYSHFTKRLAPALYTGEPLTHSLTHSLTRSLHCSILTSPPRHCSGSARVSSH